MLMPIPDPAREEAGRAWLLARTASEVLREPGDAEYRRTVLENAFRLMQAYEVEDLSFGSIHPPTANAIRDSLSESFPGIAPATAVEGLVVSLRSAAYPVEGAEMRPDAATSAFFQAIATRLTDKF